MRREPAPSSAFGTSATLAAIRNKSVMRCEAEVTGADVTPPFDPLQTLAVAIGIFARTISMMEVLAALRADHWLHSVPNRDTKLRSSIMRQVRDAFYVDVPSWKAAVYGRSADFAIRVSQALRDE